MLAFAVRKKHVGICERLLRSGASPSAPNISTGRTALIEAVHSRTFNKEIASLLQSSVNDQDPRGMTALMFAACGGGMFASRKGNQTIIHVLLELGADPLIQDCRGRTALGHAIESNDTDRNNEVISLLKHEMVGAAALREFRARKRWSFDSNGALIVVPATPEKDRKGRSQNAPRKR